MKIFLTYLLFFSFLSFSQEDKFIHLKKEEDTLAVLLNQLRNAENDNEKHVANKKLKEKFLQVLKDPLCLNYNFPKLKSIGIIQSGDNQMAIVNWNIEKDDFSHDYTCFVLHKDKKNYYVTELKDVSFGMPQKPSGVVPANQWYGALYYKIIPVKKGSKTLYTVLGWDYFSPFTQMKLIDVLYFTGKTVKLGYPLFKVGKKTKRRIWFEHSKKATMSLKYEPERNRIIFDHLSPETPSLKGFKEYYVPDLSYDSFVLTRGKWVLHEDVIAVNNSEGKKKEIYVLDPETGKIKKIKIKNKWENPSTGLNSEEHIAVTPEDEEVKKNDRTKKKQKIKDKRDPNQLTTITGKKKKKKQWFWKKRK